MHADEVAVDEPLVRRLLAAQLPQGADLPIEPGAPAWDGPPVWTHGDLDPRNLLVTQGRLSGVIDLSGVGVGDPACDVAAAWKVLPAETRTIFRDALSVDDATWARSRCRVVVQAVMILSYYTPETNDVLVLEARRWLEEVLSE